MEYRSLGGGLVVSRVGFGGWPIGGHGWGPIDDEESIAAIRTALDVGVTLFDVADVYGFGHAEEILAQGLASARHSVVVATKFGLRWEDGITRDASPRRVTEALEASLRRLRLDRIPLYQIHWPDPATPIAATMEALRHQQEQDKIGLIGCCNFTAAQFRTARKHGDVISLQTEYSVLNRTMEDDILPACIELGTGVITWGSLAQGLLAGRLDQAAIRALPPDDVRSRNPVFDAANLPRHLDVVEQLRRIGSKYGKTPGQVAVRWILDTAGVTSSLTGVKNPRQMAENAEVDWVLDERDRDMIAEIGESRPSRSG